MVVIKGSPLALTDRLTGIISVLENPQPMWEAVGFTMKENTRLRFSDQLDIYGRGLVPSIRALEEGGQTLRDTGRMMNSITFFASKKGVQWGIPAEFPYATILNTGGTIVPRTKPKLKFKVGSRWVSAARVVMPERRVIGISTEDKQDIIDVVVSFLEA